MKKKVIIILSVIVGFITLVLTGFFIYVSTYYRALDKVENYLKTTDTVIVKEYKNYYTFEGTNVKKGLIFYPGGLVESKSYAPLLYELASNGYLCILLEMPFNLAVFDINAADGIKDEYSYIDEWYIGGHSLGGSMAASYLKKNQDDYDGLILFASYSTVDFSDSNLRVISVYGEFDEVLNMENYEKSKSNLPSDFVEIVIEGGCHAYFGTYGNQKGDGEPQITNEIQIERTVEVLLLFLKD